MNENQENLSGANRYSAWEKLNELQGIDSIKQQLEAYIRAFREFRERRSHNFIPHIALTGNPGTGKTTIAKLIGEILREEGLLSNGHFVEATPTDLISGYVGGTETKTREMCKRARGGILFIDDAYGLWNEASNEHSFGKEAIDALLTFMLSPENDSVVIFAGYPKEMEYFLRNGNPGLYSRVPFKWNITDYSSEEPSENMPKSLNSLDERGAVENGENNADIAETSVQEDSYEGTVDEGQEDMSAQDEGAVPENDRTPEEGTLSSLDDIYEILGNLQFNVSLLVQNQSSAADVAVLRRENEAFRADSNIKLMRAYGIDAMIRLYQSIADRLFRLHHPIDEVLPTAEGEEKALLWVLKRMAPQFKKLGIRLQTSEAGAEFNGDSMAVYGDNGEDVEEDETMFPAEAEHPDGTIKESVCPAFIWTIPSLVGDKREWCMEPEKVCIYRN